MAGALRTIRRVQRGFTIVELMVTVAIFGILMGLAAPSFRTLYDNRINQTVSDGINSILWYARKESVVLMTPVSLCASSQPKACNSGGTTDYLVAFSDANGDGVIDAPTDEVLRVSRTNSRVTVTFPQDDLVTFLPDGFANSDIDPVDIVGPSGATQSRHVDVNLNSIITTKSDATS